MSEVSNPVEKSTWASKFSALGPGIVMASAAVGGSHIIASTQAGAIYGWELVSIVILANLFKYPFFRFGAQYTLDTGNTLLEGYRQKGRFYLWLFLILNVFATVVNTAAVGLLTAAILIFITPIPLPMPVLSSLVIVVTTGILLLGKYRLLDRLSKIIMIALTITTVSAVAIAIMRNGMQGVAPADFVAPSPWELSKLAFLVALMGWMPAPIEISAINSMWVVAKRRLTKVSYQDGLFDFNVGYIGTAILAVVFLALGALVQFGSPETVEMVGGKYIAQLINMYASTIGEWARLLIAVIAFMCMFGTTITVIDGYSRTNVESLRLLLGKHESSVRTLNISMVLAALSGLAIIFCFNNAVGPMLKFAMIASFVSAPVFAWLNLSLTKKSKHSVKGGLLWLSFIGLFYLTAFAALFIAQQAGWLS
ncbi:Nramp family divalent metal transporter [Aggregatibacter actinomycetemcomitans]|uniref:Nramp family divalent metal transporter n=1 Tax=Aggregatibacter actinomycetemcomitans TaxID=714 RepID=UPI00197B4859|nr:Nramp family divalent metal transporter [Aggregatibacter actinomycetemcomitans]MBN6063691.1 Nramp family divalent metal transporter [Aggregatibacter actinomycetemcomitans]MBN6070486.1 Nramp family divalent metal transporter [Aggregatibacter actinomycetemcomitans]MBN6083511.1 Nramp family divalent metal transporter [Aggregatibacter actinomycetemcomitans]